MAQFVPRDKWVQQQINARWFVAYFEAVRAKRGVDLVGVCPVGRQINLELKERTHVEV